MINNNIKINAVIIALQEMSFNSLLKRRKRKRFYEKLNKGFKQNDGKHLNFVIFFIIIYFIYLYYI